MPSKTASGAQGTASDPDAGSHPYRGSDAEAVAGSAGPWERSSPHQPVVPEELSSTAVGKVFGQGEPLAQPLLAKSESGRWACCKIPLSCLMIGTRREAALLSAPGQWHGQLLVQYELSRRAGGLHISQKGSVKHWSALTAPPLLAMSQSGMA